MIKVRVEIQITLEESEFKAEEFQQFLTSIDDGSFADGMNMELDEGKMLFTSVQTQYRVSKTP